MDRDLIGIFKINKSMYKSMFTKILPNPVQVLELYKVPSKVKQVEKSIWSCNGGCGKRSGGQEEVWRCSNDKRMSFKGTCDFDLCGECVVKINKEGNFYI